MGRILRALPNSPFWVEVHAATLPCPVKVSTRVKARVVAHFLRHHGKMNNIIRQKNCSKFELARARKRTTDHDVDVLKYSEKSNVIRTRLKVVGCKITILITKFTSHITPFVLLYYGFCMLKYSGNDIFETQNEKPLLI